jgi:hypothetical protein
MVVALGTDLLVLLHLLTIDNLSAVVAFDPETLRDPNPLPFRLGLLRSILSKPGHQTSTLSKEMRDFSLPT